MQVHPVRHSDQVYPLTVTTFLGVKEGRGVLDGVGQDPLLTTSESAKTFRATIAHTYANDEYWIIAIRGSHVPIFLFRSIPQFAVQSPRIQAFPRNGCCLTQAGRICFKYKKT